jgi:hypothetical protein
VALDQIVPEWEQGKWDELKVLLGKWQANKRQGKDKCRYQVKQGDVPAEQHKPNEIQ